MIEIPYTVQNSCKIGLTKGAAFDILSGPRSARPLRSTQSVYGKGIPLFISISKVLADLLKVYKNCQDSIIFCNKLLIFECYEM